MFISNIIYNSYVCANWNALKKNTTCHGTVSPPLLKGRSNKYVTHFFTLKKKCLQSKYVTQPNQTKPKWTFFFQNV
jgi:hypothetical protein